MPLLSLKIVRFVEEHQPNIVACEFIDANDCLHTIIDKAAMFTGNDLERSSQYPQAGMVRCEVLDTSRDHSGRTLVWITLDRPDRIETTDGRSEFLVLDSQISDDPIETGLSGNA